MPHIDSFSPSTHSISLTTTPLYRLNLPKLNEHMPTELNYSDAIRTYSSLSGHERRMVS